MNKPEYYLETLKEIGARLRTQDNRCTSDPMFCVQRLVRTYGIDPDYCDNTTWIDKEEFCEVEEGAPGSYEVGYIDHWEDVMVAFTEEGARQYIERNGHNIRNLCEPRIFAKSFYRCPEMIDIREYLMSLPEPG